MKFIHLGKGTLVRDDEILGIFDLDITSQSHLTRKFLSLADKSGKVINAAEDLPKSFVVAEKNGRETVYLSQLNSATLLRRAESGFFDSLSIEH